ncbi:MAG: hypothetical protein R3B90_09915 [Planctomycetaceae bacterium]
MLRVRNNQPTLSATIVDEFDRHAESGYQDRNVREQTTTEQSRGRTETRTCLVTPATAKLQRTWAVSRPSA